MEQFKFMNIWIRFWWPPNKCVTACPQLYWPPVSFFVLSWVMGVPLVIIHFIFGCVHEIYTPSYHPYFNSFFPFFHEINHPSIRVPPQNGHLHWVPGFSSRKTGENQVHKVPENREIRSQRNPPGANKRWICCMAMKGWCKCSKTWHAEMEMDDPEMNIMDWFVREKLQPHIEW